MIMPTEMAHMLVCRCTLCPVNVRYSWWIISYLPADITAACNKINLWF